METKLENQAEKFFETPEARRREVAKILAAGLLRLKPGILYADSETCQPRSFENPLDFSSFPRTDGADG